MKAIPDFVEQVGPYWVLKNDTGAAPIIKRTGRLAWDDVFTELPELRAMPKGSCFVDVGAFIGDTTRVAIELGMFALAFESQSDAFICLEHNCPESVNRNFPLGDGRIVSIVKSDAGNLGARALTLNGDIITRQLDDWFIPPQPTFLKLDAEGFEPAILRGSGRLLANPLLKYIACEFNPSALARYGYTTQDILKYLPGWKSREIFRFKDENWDLLFWR